MSTAWWPLLAVLLLGCASASASDEDPPVAATPDPPGVARDLAYGKEPMQALDLFVPDDVKGEPLVAFVHGGAWQGGSRHEYDEVALRFQKTGLAVATVDYRLSPGVRHPAPAQDVAEALGWLRDHAAKYGYDSKRIFVIGHSAGAHIAATISTTPALRVLAQPAGFVGMEGIYDLPALAKRWPSYPSWFLNKAFGADQGTWAAASPTRAATVSPKPWLVVHSKGDELVDVGQADGFVAFLRRMHVPAQVLKPEGKTHDGIVGSLASPDDAVAKAILAFVKRGV